MRNRFILKTSVFLLAASTLISGSFLALAAYGPLSSAEEYEGICNAQSIFSINGTYYEAYSTSSPRWMMAGGAGGNATAINDNGYMTGSVDGAFHDGYVWPPTGGTIGLEYLPNANTNRPQAINNIGQVAGYSGTTGPNGYLENSIRACLWTNYSNPTNLGTLGGNWSAALDINDQGKVAGYSELSNGGIHACLWTNNSDIVDLGTLGGNWSWAQAINNEEQVAGFSQRSDGLFHPFIWTAESGMSDLGSLASAVVASGVSPEKYLGYAQVGGINEHGEIVGYQKMTTGNFHAFFWSPIKGWVDLGAKLEGLESRANDINDHGQIVGSHYDSNGANHIVLWQNLTTPTDIDVDHNSSSDHFTIANAINNVGQIAGKEWDAAVMWALTPLPDMFPCDAAGNEKYVFQSSENILAYVIVNQQPFGYWFEKHKSTWVEGEALKGDFYLGMGGIGWGYGLRIPVNFTTVVWGPNWSSPNFTVPGSYDIILDFADGGFFDPGIDVCKTVTVELAQPTPTPTLTPEPSASPLAPSASVAPTNNPTASPTPTQKPSSSPTNISPSPTATATTEPSPEVSPITSLATSTPQTSTSLPLPSFSSSPIASNSDYDVYPYVLVAVGVSAAALGGGAVVVRRRSKVRRTR